MQPGHPVNPPNPALHANDINSTAPCPDFPIKSDHHTYTGTIHKDCIRQIKNQQPEALLPEQPFRVPDNCFRLKMINFPAGHHKQNAADNTIFHKNLLPI